MNYRWMFVGLMVALSEASGVSAMQGDTDESWWEKRRQRSDIFYPHNAHIDVMANQGDSCFLCHPFGPIEITDPAKVEALRGIANESLRAICHDCHVGKRTAPWRCTLCHDDLRKIRPAGHGPDYRDHHGLAAREDRGQCRSCHIDLNFCTDCHFRRNVTDPRFHDLAYRGRHGLDARIDPSRCSRCHNAFYCRDCHRRRGR